MSSLGDELREITKYLSLDDKRIIGRDFFAKITDNLITKISFQSHHTSGCYESLLVKIINTQGESLYTFEIFFEDLFEPICPRLDRYDKGQYKWNFYPMMIKDYRKIAEALNNYFYFFKNK